MHYDTKCPYINSLSISLALCLFWRHVQYSASLIHDDILSRVYVHFAFCWEPKISYFSSVLNILFFSLLRAVYIQQNIFRFQVPVNVVFIMDVTQSFQYIIHYLTTLFFTHYRTTRWSRFESDLIDEFLQCSSIHFLELNEYKVLRI